jgi:hypothetical protein
MIHDPFADLMRQANDTYGWHTPGVRRLFSQVLFVAQADPSQLQTQDPGLGAPFIPLQAVQ